MQNFMATLIFLTGFGAWAEMPVIKGPDLFTGQAIETRAHAKGLVVVFLSAKCPCSNSHVTELKNLAQTHKDFAFVAIHSNVDEGKELTHGYFKNAALPFPVIHDDGAKIADTFKAYKTPHAFVLSPAGQTLYKGGVSNSKDCEKADRKFLREALEDVAKNKSVRTPEGRTVGCAIARGEKHVW